MEAILEVIQVERSLNLRGKARTNGAKNSTFPIVAASLLGTEPMILEDTPRLKDVSTILKVLEELGSKVTYLDRNKVEIDSSSVNNSVIPRELMNKTKASFLMIGPSLTKLDQAKAYLLGECATGSRPVGLHLKRFKALGTEIESTDERIEAIAENGPIGGGICLDFPNVSTTRNTMMAATMAKGETAVKNAAKEPEVADLMNLLNKLGAKVRGAGTSTIRTIGADKLHGAKHTIIPDRIEATVFMVASAITRDGIIAKDCISSHIMLVIAKLHEVGCEVTENEDEGSTGVIAARRLRRTKIKTLPCPGFPTNMQAQFMTLMTVCKGQSSAGETVFENRFMYAKRLQRMDAAIATEKNKTNIAGVDSLQRAAVKFTDLGAGVALILAGPAADGTTNATGIYRADRGYDDIVSEFKKLGANIERIGIKG